MNQDRDSFLRVTSRPRRWLWLGPAQWLAAGAIVTIAWLLGLLLWRGLAPTEGFGVLPFDPMYSVAGVALHGVPLAVLAGLVRGATRFRVIGTAVLVATTLWLAWDALMSSFGGFCLDPGEDVCLVSTADLAAGLLTPLACLVAGCVVEIALLERRRASRLG